jgi:modification methylase
MKNLNDGLQMRSDWKIPLCTGAERLKVNGKKAHSTQKPEALLFRVILSSTNPNDIILDPFFGTGTTGAVAKKLSRRWIGIEVSPSYVELAQERLDSIQGHEEDIQIYDARDYKRSRPRIPFRRLVENGFLNSGQNLYFNGDKNIKAVIKPDSNLLIDGFVGSIHQSAKHLTGGKPSNGWLLWFYETEKGDLKQIDELRSAYASHHEIEVGKQSE